MQNMQQTRLNIEPMSTTNYNVAKLQKWLDYELSGMTLLFLSYIFHATIYLAAIAAIIFIPVLLKVLIEERRFGWLITFFVFIVVPPSAASYVFGYSMWTLITVITVLGFFYFYCGLLRLVIREWGD